MFSLFFSLYGYVGQNNTTSGYYVVSGESPRSKKMLVLCNYIYGRALVIGPSSKHWLAYCAVLKI